MSLLDERRRGRTSSASISTIHADSARRSKALLRKSWAPTIPARSSRTKDDAYRDRQPRPSRTRPRSSTPSWRTRSLLERPIAVRGDRAVVAATTRKPARAALGPNNVHLVPGTVRHMDSNDTTRGGRIRTPDMEFTARERQLLSLYYSVLEKRDHADIYLVRNLPPEVAATLNGVYSPQQPLDARQLLDRGSRRASRKTGRNLEDMDVVEPPRGCPDRKSWPTSSGKFLKTYAIDHGHNSLREGSIRSPRGRERVSGWSPASSSASGGVRSKNPRLATSPSATRGTGAIRMCEVRRRSRRRGLRGGHQLDLRTVQNDSRKQLMEWMRQTSARLQGR